MEWWTVRTLRLSALLLLLATNSAVSNEDDYWDSEGHDGDHLQGEKNRKRRFILEQ